MKKTLSLILALAMVFTLAACGSDAGTPSAEPSAEPTESAAPEANALTDGYYTYGYSVEGMGDMVRYLHFYEDIGLGGICFYASSGGGTQSVIGFYTVEDKPFDYSCWATREERNSEGTGQTAGTAPQIITLTGVNGDTLGSVGYDGQYIYVGDENVSAFVIADARNMRFGRDLVFTMGLLGELTAKGDFADPANPAYTLEIPELADLNLSAATLTYGAQAKTVSFTFTGPVPQTAYNMEGTYTLTAYEDETCELSVELAGNTAPVDAGTYHMDETYSFVFALDTLGELTTTADFSDPANPVYTLGVPAVEAFSLGEATIGYGQAGE